MVNEWLSRLPADARRSADPPHRVADRIGSATGNGWRRITRVENGGKIHDLDVIRFCSLVDKRCKNAARERAAWLWFRAL
jgi:hypothetical protein